MNHEKVEKVDPEDHQSLFTNAQKLFIRIRKTSMGNETLEISTLDNTDEADQADPLRVPEIIIVICVLLLWCISIFIFIRHSQLLRIRHRDIPYRSTLKPPANLNHVSLTSHTNDAAPHHKSGLSSTGGLTPPVDRHAVSELKPLETNSLSVSPSSWKRQHKPALNRGTSLTTHHSIDKPDDKQQLLDPSRISTEVKEGLLELHRRSVENLSTLKCSTSQSINDVQGRQHNEKQHLVIKKRLIQESPV